MTTLTLKKTASQHGGEWPDNDYLVLNDGQVVGRIMLHPQALKDKPWFWTITARVPQSTADRGYSATREQPMAAFKKVWQTGDSGKASN